MKIKDGLDLSILLDYGFEKIDKKAEEENENYTVSYFDYAYNIGHARRGQFYYLLVNEITRVVSIYASEPDGSGTSVLAPNVLIDLIAGGVISRTISTTEA